jgi:hypothetical protein
MVHRSISRSPDQARRTDDPLLWTIQYKLKPKPIKREEKNPPKIRYPYKFKVNDKVRLSFLRTTFQRQYDQRWTSEIFIITGRDIKQNLSIYTLKSWNNESIEGTFYEPELQKIDVDENKVFKIEKIVKKRTINKQKQALVRWEGWSKQYDTWLPESELKDI